MPLGTAYAEQIDLKGGLLHVRRVKQGTPATHPLTGRELRALRRLEREAAGLPFVFVSERGAPFAARGFQAMVERAGKAAGFDMQIHPDCAAAMLSGLESSTSAMGSRFSAPKRAKAR